MGVDREGVVERPGLRCVPANDYGTELVPDLNPLVGIELDRSLDLVDEPSLDFAGGRVGCSC